MKCYAETAWNCSKVGVRQMLVPGPSKAPGLALLCEACAALVGEVRLREGRCPVCEERNGEHWAQCSLRTTEDKTIHTAQAFTERVEKGDWPCRVSRDFGRIWVRWKGDDLVRYAIDYEAANTILELRAIRDVNVKADEL